MAFCRSCAKEVGDNDEKCTHCGIQIVQGGNKIMSNETKLSETVQVELPNTPVKLEVQLVQPQRKVGTSLLSMGFFVFTGITGFVLGVNAQDGVLDNYFEWAHQTVTGTSSVQVLDRSFVPTIGTADVTVDEEEAEVEIVVEEIDAGTVSFRGEVPEINIEKMSSLEELDWAIAWEIMNSAVDVLLPEADGENEIQLIWHTMWEEEGLDRPFSVSNVSEEEEDALYKALFSPSSKAKGFSNYEGQSPWAQSTDFVVELARGEDGYVTFEFMKDTCGEAFGDLNLDEQYREFVDANHKLADISTAFAVLEAMEIAVAQSSTLPAGVTVTWTEDGELSLAGGSSSKRNAVKAELEEVFGEDLEVGEFTSSWAKDVLDSKKGGEFTFTIGTDEAGDGFIYTENEHLAFNLEIASSEDDDMVTKEPSF